MHEDADNSPPRPGRRTRRYLPAFAVTALAVLGAIAVLNLLVDPYRAYRILASPALDSAKPTGSNRVTKAEMVCHETAETIVLGSSRVEAGIDPVGPALAGRRALNLGLAGASMYEVYQAFQFARRRMPLRSVILLVEFPAFNASRKLTREDFTKSRFDPDRPAWEYHVENLIGWDAVEYSFRTLGRAMSGQPRRPFPALGHTVPEKLVALGFRRAVKRQLAAPAADRASTYRLNEPALGLFRDLILACRHDGIRLYLAVPPVHAIHMEDLHATDQWDAYENWKRAIVRIVDEQNAAAASAPASAAAAAGPLVLWDFANYNRYTTEEIPPASAANPRMQYHYDQAHFTPAFGELLLHRILAPSTGSATSSGQTPASSCPVAVPPVPRDANDIDLSGLGVIITPACLEAHLARIRAGRETYAASHAADLADLMPAGPRNP